MTSVRAAMVFAIFWLYLCVFECKNKYYTYKWKCHLDVIMRFDKYICVVYSK